MSPFYPFRGGIRLKGTMSPFLPFFLEQGFPNLNISAREKNYPCCITYGASSPVHQLQCIILRASTSVHHPPCITPGASPSVHHPWCINSNASFSVHQLRCITLGAPPPVHHPCCIILGASFSVHHSRCFTSSPSPPCPIKCFRAPSHQILAKCAPQKACNRNKAEFATKVRKLT